MTERKIRRLRVVSNGKHTKVYFSDTGEEVPGVQGLRFEHKMYGRPVVFVEQMFVLDEFDITADAPKGALTEADARAEAEEFNSELEGSGLVPAPEEDGKVTIRTDYC